MTQSMVENCGIAVPMGVLRCATWSGFLLAALAVGCGESARSAATGAAPAHGDADACQDTPGTCPTPFRLPLGDYAQVELRGDFRDGGWVDGQPLGIDGGAWTATLDLQAGSTIRYKFLVDGSRWVTDPANPRAEPDGVGGENSVLTAACVPARCLAETPNHETPATGGSPITSSGTSSSTSSGGVGGGPPVASEGDFDWRSAVMYFVFVDRFRNGDPSNDAPVPGVESRANYQGGDWQGVIQAIDSGYFADLGVNALWLTVPMDNPNDPGAGFDGHDYSGYHGYWPSDLNAPEEHFGTLERLQELVSKAHAHGLKVLFDYAMNHVHKSSPLFAEHADWFWPLDFDGKHCVCGQGCDWNDPTDQKRCWFTDYLPDWNFQNGNARAFSVDNAIQWAKDTGADGFRLDAVKHIELSWVSDLRARATSELEPDTKSRFYMVGETFESGNRDFIRSFVSPDLLDGQFDFPLRGQLVEKLLLRWGSMFDLESFVASNDSFYPGVMSTFLGNHDLARIIHLAEDAPPWGPWDNGGDAPWLHPPALPSERSAFERVAVAFTFLFTTPEIAETRSPQNPLPRCPLSSRSIYLCQPPA